MSLILKKILWRWSYALMFLGSSISFAELNTAQLTKKFSAVKGADHSVLFVRLSDGATLYELNADQLLSPASVTKVVTSAAALSYFGPAFSFKTPIQYSGPLKSGVLKGNLYVKGMGDPFLVSEHLWQMAIDLRHLGVREITGDILIDHSLFDREDRDESRINSTQKSTHAYDAPVSAFAVNFNTVAVATAPSINGQTARSEVTPFPLLHVKLSGQTKTVRGTQNNQVTISRNATSDGGISLIAGGTIGSESELKKLYRSVGNPRVASGDYVLGFLKDAGIRVKGGVREGLTPMTANPLYEITGYEMRRITQGLNTFSNNFIADMLTKRLGASFKDEPFDRAGSGTLLRGVEVLNSFLRSDVGLKTEFRLFNGSGLSTENRFSSKQIATVLTWMEKRGELFPDFLGSLPANGWDGTLKKRNKNTSDILGFIRAKSGTLTEPITVAALAGYFRHPKEGWVAFSMISNGREGAGQPGLMELRNQQDDVLKGILLN